MPLSKKFRFSKPWKILITILALLSTWLIFLALDITLYANQTTSTSADAAIVLGAGVINDQPSPVLRERINHALNLYRAGVVDYLIFTGGIGQGDRMTESEVARQYALEQGIPADRIMIETASHITYENLLEARKIILAQGFDRVLIVSDPLHMRRAMTMADDLDLNAFPSPTPTSAYVSWQRKAKFLAREVFFYAGYLIQRWFSFA
ncbi:MAG TPA: YdcF family protein [Anaerolineales bacterium]|nr:YdcF family protein [Anaerolineales bacterium]